MSSRKLSVAQQEQLHKKLLIAIANLSHHTRSSHDIAVLINGCMFYKPIRILTGEFVDCIFEKHGGRGKYRTFVRTTVMTDNSTRKRRRRRRFLLYLCRLRISLI